MRIITIIREKNIDIELIKIRYSDIELNEEADRLAKEGNELGWNLDSFFTCNSKHISFFPHFHSIPIEHKFRSFISSMFRTKDKVE